MLDAEPNYYGINKSWRPLQDFLVKVIRPKHPHIKSKDAAYKLAADYIHAWETISFTYVKLKEKTSDNELRIQQKKIASDGLAKELWEKLNNHRMHMANNLSLSFLIDRSLDHFKMILKSEAEMASAKKYDSDSDDCIIESPPQNQVFFN